ncbi:MAG: amino acid adenylation domain-containing protein [Ruminiclostridium sp.]|nr:amino acid adenylation domain-containing protein [Ruminiclostridium sp.]
MSVCRDLSSNKMFNNTDLHIPFVPVNEQIHRQAVTCPEKTAVICCGERMSYKELDKLSDSIARALIGNCVKRNELVAVLFEREPTAYAAEIAVLKAGAGFVPFVPEYPDDRIDYCMKDCGCRLLLTTNKIKESRHFYETDYEVITVEEILQTEQLSDRNISFPQVSENDLAYCIYTSGTTGRPKGVLIEHRNIANYVNKNEVSTEVVYLAEPGRISLALAAFSFDFSLEEELVPLCSGNTVVIATSEQIHDPVKFADMVIETGADATMCTPTYLCGLLSVYESREALKRIKLFHIGAEMFPKRLYSMLRGLRKDSVIMNVYGPTECTIISSSSVVTGDDVITIGKPRANVRFYIFDRAGNELPAGQKGELIIGGAQIGRYVGQTDTEGAFFTYKGQPAYHTGDLAEWTENGEVMICGRIDDQVKLRGCRVELSEIEAVMTEYPGIISAAAALKNKGDSVYLVGYYTAAATVDKHSLKRHLKTKLPDYMIPSVFVKIDKMPVSINGKIDRNALPETDNIEPDTQYIPPVSEKERRLCRAFEKALKRPEHSVGLTDDFFDLSGDSISAMELLAEAEIEGLTYSDIFTFRTPAEILRELDKREQEQQNTDLDKLDSEARLVPHLATPVQKELMDVQLTVPNGATVSSIRFLMLLGGDVAVERFCDALNAALANHPGFAFKFFRDADGRLLQKYDPALIPKVEIKEIPPETEETLAETLITPFDRLLDNSLCRAALYHGKRGLYFFMDVHHLLADGLSLRPILGDIADGYNGNELKKDCYPALLAMEEKRMSEGRYETDKAYLLNRYGGYDWCVMPFVPDPACNENGAVFKDRLGFNADRVKAASERLSASFSVMHIAAILLAMYHFTGKSDVMAFWTFHNRQTADAENAVGMFIKTLPVGVHMSELHSVNELLLSVKEQVVSGVAHSAYSYLVEQVYSRRIVWIESNMQVDFEGPDNDIFAPGYIELKNAYTDTADNVMLAIISESGHDDGGYDITFDYKGKGIKTADVERLHKEITAMLEAIVLDEGSTDMLC